MDDGAAGAVAVEGVDAGACVGATAGAGDLAAPGRAEGSDMMTRDGARDGWQTMLLLTVNSKWTRLSIARIGCGRTSAGLSGKRHHE